MSYAGAGPEPRALKWEDVYNPEFQKAVAIVAGVCLVAIVAVLACLNACGVTPNHWREDEMRDGMDQPMEDFGLNEEGKAGAAKGEKKPKRKRKESRKTQ